MIRLLNTNLAPEPEVEHLVVKLIDELHSAYRQRAKSPALDFERKEQAVLTQLNLLAELFPQSRFTGVEVKMNRDRWKKTGLTATPGIKITYEQDT